jgi:hypothetical protein
VKSWPCVGGEEFNLKSNRQSENLTGLSRVNGCAYTNGECGVASQCHDTLKPQGPLRVLPSAAPKPSPG